MSRPYHVINRGTCRGVDYRVLLDLDPAAPRMIWIAALPGGRQAGHCTTPEEGIRSARATIRNRQ